MNKILSRGLFAALLFSLTACVNSSKSHYRPARTGSASDNFRIGMNVNSSDGQDIKNWQSFLIFKGFGLTHDNSDHDNSANGSNTHPYPNRKFDQEVEEATKRFQASCNQHDFPDYGIAVTGEVNWATYFQAVKQGMTAYPPTGLSAKSLKLHGLKLHHFELFNANDVIHKLQLGCLDFNIVSDKDVSDWQVYLQNMGYLGAGYPTGTFGSTTQMATKQFQIDFAVNVGSGILDQATFTKAKQNGFDSTYTFSNTNCRNH